VKAIVSAGVEPGETPPKPLYMKIAALEIGAVDVGDLKLAARRRFYALGNVNDIAIIEIEAGDRSIGPRIPRLLLGGASAIGG